MSTEHGDSVGPIPVARSFNALLTDDEIIEFWKSNRSLTALRLLLGVVRRRDARQILRAIGEAHPNKEIPGRPWPRLSTSKKIVTAINRFFVEPMQHEQEAALRDVLRVTLWKEKAEIGLKFEALIAASDIEGVKQYIREMTELVDSITMAPPPVPPPKEKRSGREGLVTRGGVTGQVDPNTSESDLSESETEEGGRSGAS
jgi:hypothetical protein